MHRARLSPFTLCGDHKAKKLEALRTAARPHDVLGQRIFDLLEVRFPVESDIAGLQLLDQVSWNSLTVEQGHASCTRLFTPSHAVLCQYDAMPQLLDAGIGGQDDEDGQASSAPAQEADMHLCSCASLLEAHGWRLPGPTRRKESSGQPRISVEHDVLHGQEFFYVAEAKSRQGAVALQSDTEAQKIRGEICNLQGEARATSSTRVDHHVSGHGVRRTSWRHSGRTARYHLTTCIGVGN